MVEYTLLDDPCIVELNPYVSAQVSN